MSSAASTPAADAGPVTNSRVQPVWRQYYALTKPRVVQLLMFCTLVGMVLAVPGIPTLAELGRMAVACVGVWMITAAAAVANCLLEKSVDARMLRTMSRPTASGALSDRGVLVFSLALCAGGCAILALWVNMLTMWLTFATFIGYVVVYTLWLKPNTPQNIVIGGATGAMPPVFGWAAMTGTTSLEVWLLFLIICIWTPAHFWPLAMYRLDEYRQSGLPMMPVVRGVRYTSLQVFIYTVLLFFACLLPFAIGSSGWLYLAVVVPLSAIFVGRAWMLWRDYSERRALKTFLFSLIHLSALFIALLVDHYVA